MKQRCTYFLAAMAVLACTGLPWKPALGQRPKSAGMTGGHPSAHVNPFIGASTSAGKAGIFPGGLGKTFPGAATPFGMVQVSPNTITGGDNGSGYSYEHTSIEGFAFTQMSGVGWYGDLGNFLVMPSEGPLKTIPGRMDHPGEGYRSAYAKSSEKASVGYYSVMLSESHIRAEMSAAPHSGILRFTFPKSRRSRIQIDLARRVGGTSTLQYIQVVDDHTIRGWMKCTPDGGGWGDGEGKADYTVYLFAQFSKPLRQIGAWSADIPDDWSRKREDIESDRYRERVAVARLLKGRAADSALKGGAGLRGTHLGFYTEFATGDKEQVILKAGISFVSMEGAERNLETEIGSWNFDKVHAQAVALWDHALGKIAVEGGTEEETTVFYTAFYHTMIDPRTLQDVDGSYPGGDEKIHRAATFTRRTVFSGWDVFRSQFPLQTIINPHVVNDMINSLVHLADENGKHYLERWEFLNAYSGCMIGNPAVSVMADAYAKGIRNFDIDKGYLYARNSCELFGNGKEGYTFGENGISKTLEYAYSDWCLSALAGGLGKKEDQALYAGKAAAYRNTFDDSVGWFRPRRQDGSWEPWPEQGRLQQDYGTVESNPYQQGWFVPQDIPGMVTLMGGREKVAADLADFFERTPDNMMWNDYYNHANEPVHHVAFLFNRIGYPWLTQKWTRAICRRAYHNTVEGLVGNEDVGQMSAWYVLAATGIHPVCPGETRYEITSPVFKKIEIRLDPAYARGKTFTIIARNNSPENIYIQGALLNGKPYEKCWLDHSDIMAGGVLELTMGKEAAHWPDPYCSIRHH
jgi:predicted alpha-1,2-mannosidase